MKARRGRWLDTALRAQEARTLDRHDRVVETSAACDHAARHEAAAQQELQALVSSWREVRSAARSTTHLDTLYRRFHAQLHIEAVDAAQAHADGQRALDAALVQLRQSHAMQQALGRTVERRDRRDARDEQARARGLAVEAWLLTQACMKESSE